MNLKKHFIIGINLLFFLFARDIFAYQVKKGEGVGNTFIPSKISSVLGEPRKQSPPQEGAGIPYRFHKGVDIADYNRYDRVQPIEGGTILQRLTVDGELRGLRIQNPSGRIFDYIHIILESGTNAGVIVTSTMTIGTIDATDHLHLDEISGNLCLNPLHTGGLEHEDSDIPVFIGSTGIGNESVSVIRENESAAIKDGDAFNATTSTFPIVDGKRVISGKVDVLVSVRDDIGFRKGVYIVNCAAYHPTTWKFFYNPAFENIRFNYISNSDPYSEIKTLYRYRNSDSDVMFATNELLQSESNIDAGENEWNTTGNPDGPATIMTRVDDIDGHNGPYNFWDVTIDNNPPMIFLETPLNNSIIYDRRPVISAQYSDLGSGMDLTAVKMYLDGSAVAPTTNELVVTFTPAYVKNNFGG